MCRSGRPDGRAGLSVIAELIRRIRSAVSDERRRFSMGDRPEARDRRHYFEILLTISNATHADQYVTSTYQGSTVEQERHSPGIQHRARFGRVRHR